MEAEKSRIIVIGNPESAMSLKIEECLEEMGYKDRRIVIVGTGEGPIRDLGKSTTLPLGIALPPDVIIGDPPGEVPPEGPILSPMREAAELLESLEYPPPSRGLRIQPPN